MGFLKFDEADQKYQEEQANKPKGKWIRTLALKEGDVATFRFLTDKPDLLVVPMHSVAKISTKGKDFREDVYCTKGDGEPCPNCAQGVPVITRIFGWCYVYYILHKFQNPRLDGNPQAPRWAYVKVGDKNLYKEDVNDVLVFKTGIGKGAVYSNAIKAFYEEYGSILDRDYKWSRAGQTKDDTSYNLLAKDPTDLSDVVKTANKGLPKLDDFVTGKVKTFSSGENVVTPVEEPVAFEETPKTKTKKKATEDNPSKLF